jgi:hypothetical protein
MKEDKEDPFDFITRRATELSQDINDRDETPEMKRKREIEDREESKKYFEETIMPQKESETELEKYCRDIRGEVADWELTFEEFYKQQKEHEKSRDKILTEFEQLQNSFDNTRRPKGISNKEWEKRRKRIKRELREQRKQKELDDKLVFTMSPLAMMEDKISSIRCRCEAEQIRAGHYCDTCKLLVKVNDFLMRLFKDTAQGRR